MNVIKPTLRPVEWVVAVLLTVGVVYCVRPGWFGEMNTGADYAVQLMLGYLTLGLLFLVLKRPRLTFVSFLGCAVLALFLRHSVTSSTDAVPVPPPAGNPFWATFGKSSPHHFSVAHFNLSNATANVSGALQAMRYSDADLLSVQELTPLWTQLLIDSLKDFYPHYTYIEDIGMFGLAVFSRYELCELDTFYFRGVPNLSGCVWTESGREVHFFTTHTFPALDKISAQHQQQHFQIVEDYLAARKPPLMFVFGDFNAVPWSNEILRLRKRANLLDSRTGFMNTYNDGQVSFFDIPYDHIFFSPTFRCLEFKTLNAPDAWHLGIQGFYRFNDPGYELESKIQ